MDTIRNILTLISVTAMMAMLSGCGGTVYVPVNVQDNTASVVSVKAQWLHQAQVSELNKNTANEGFEIQYIGMRGNEEQSLPDGQFISIGDVTIMGPQTLLHNIDISYAHIAYSAAAQLAEYPLDSDIFIGASRISYRLHSSVITSPPPTIQAEDENVDYALTMGLGLRWWFIDKTAIEGRLTIATQNPLSFFFDSFRRGDQTDLLEGELALVYKPFDSVAFRGGYAMMDLAPEKQSGSSSFDFRLGGPFLGLVVLF